MRIFWDFKRAFMGLPFVVPLIKGAIVFPVAFFSGLYVLQYGLTSDIYYDEYDGQARQSRQPTLN